MHDERLNNGIENLIRKDHAEDAGAETVACLLVFVLASVLLAPRARWGAAITLASEQIIIIIKKCF